MVGSYELSGPHLTFSQMASSLMACTGGMGTEKAFLKALAEVKKWKTEGQRHELLDGDSHLLARFEARYIE